MAELTVVEKQDKHNDQQLVLSRANGALVAQPAIGPGQIVVRDASGGTLGFLNSFNALMQGDEIETNDLITVMSVGAIMILSMVMLFQQMSLTMMMKKLL